MAKWTHSAKPSRLLVVVLVPGAAELLQLG